MSCKRKFVADYDDVAQHNSKQLKLVPFPNYVPDVDVTMSEPDTYSPQYYHSRMSSNASTWSTLSSASNSPVGTSYPSFDLYPVADADTANTSVSTPNVKVGLLQPSPGFTHHGSNCSQVPKLRLACSSGPNGRRTMWSFCEQCGSISMVDND